MRPAAPNRHSDRAPAKAGAEPEARSFEITAPGLRLRRSEDSVTRGPPLRK